MTVSHSAQMLLKLEKCIPISHVTLETVPKYVNIERQANFMPVKTTSCERKKFFAIYGSLIYMFPLGAFSIRTI